MDAVRSILLAVDPDDPRPEATARVGALARAAGAGVVVAAISGPTPSALEALAAALPGAAPAPPGAGPDAAAAAVADLRAAGVDARLVHAPGDPAPAIAAAALREGCGLIVKPAAPGMTGGRYGPDDLRLLREAAPPVWALPAGARVSAPDAPVLAAIAPDPGDPALGAIARKVLRFAATLARLERRPLLAMTALRLGAGGGPLALGFGDEALRSLREAAVLATRERLAATVADSGAEATVVGGDADVEVAAEAARRGADVVVIGSHGRRGIVGALMGDTAEEVLRRAPCGVVVVKPDGFANPPTAGD